MRRLQLGIKRLLDIILSLMVIVLGSPLFVLTAILVKVSSPGPIFFVQERIGKDGKPFRMIKFRSMVVAEEQQEQARGWTDVHEARLTPLGRFLRDYGLDELPQMFSILKGDMSIVGPRPPLPVRAKDFTERQRKIFHMRPGLVCLAVLQGRRSIPIEERIELHVQYVENWSIWLDVVILARAVPVVLSRRDVNEVIIH